MDLLFDIHTPEAPSFGNFVAEGNEEALAAVRALSVPGAAAGSALLVWGPPGSGKSHLLCAARAEARSRGLSVDDAAAGDVAAPTGADLAVADDADRLGDGGQARLFSAIDSNRVSGRPAVLVSCPEPPLGLDLREDLRTRLGSCVVIGLRRLSEDAKRRALHAYARRMGRMVDPEVVDHLLLRHPRNLGRLLAALRELDRYAIARGVSLNVRTVREWGSLHPGEAG